MRPVIGEEKGYASGLGFLGITANSARGNHAAHSSCRLDTLARRYCTAPGPRRNVHIATCTNLVRRPNVKLCCRELSRQSHAKSLLILRTTESAYLLHCFRPVRRSVADRLAWCWALRGAPVEPYRALFAQCRAIGGNITMWPHVRLHAKKGKDMFTAFFVAEVNQAYNFI